MTTIPTRRPTPRPTAKAAPIPPKEPTVTAKYRQDDAVMAILAGSTFPPTTDIDTARAQGIDVALRAVARVWPGAGSALPTDHPGVVKHVIRDPDGKITSVIEENATLRTVQ
jgi:hypothetical protein